jgi:hypothetical protein
MAEKNIGEQFKGIVGKSLLRDAKANVIEMTRVHKYPTNVKGLIDADSHLFRAIDSHNSGNWLASIHHLTTAANHVMKQTNEYADSRFGTPILDTLPEEDTEKYMHNFLKFHSNLDRYVKLYAEGIQE